DTISPATPAAVISYRYWQRRFGLNSGALGKTFTLRNNVFTIVGGTPRGDGGTRPRPGSGNSVPPLMMGRGKQRREDGLNMLSMMGRLRPGATIDQANAELKVIWQGIVQRRAAAAAEKERPGILRQRAAVLSAAEGFSSLRNDYSEALLILMGI